MAIARNGTGFDLGLDTGLSGAVATVAYTVGASSDYLIIGFMGAVNSTDNVSSVTYNGVAMTKIDTRLQTGDRRIWVYNLIAPATGTHNIVITWSAAPDHYQAMGADYSGTLQSAQPDGSNGTNAATSPESINVTVTASSCWMWAFHREFAGTTTTWTGVTQLQASSGLHMADSNATIGTGSVNVQANSGGNESSLIAASFAPATGGGGRTTKNTRAFPLGMAIGMNFVGPGECSAPMARHDSGLWVPERLAA